MTAKSPIKGGISPRASKNRAGAEGGISRRVLAVLLLFTAQAGTVLALLDFFPAVQRSPPALAATGVISLAASAFAAQKLFERILGPHAVVPVSATFFTVTCWSACVDLILALSLLGS